jgi:hypothetical protein
MQIKLNCNYISVGTNYRPGQIIDLPDSRVKDMLAKGLASLVPDNALKPKSNPDILKMRSNSLVSK